MPRQLAVETLLGAPSPGPDPLPLQCHSCSEAERLMETLQERFASCRAQLHPQKIKAAYYKDRSQRGQFSQIHLTFLGFCLRPRMARNRCGEIFTSLLPAVSPQALKRMWKKIWQRQLRR